MILFQSDMWVDKYRPTVLNDMVLSDSNKQLLEKFKATNRIPHLMLIGNPGIGKSTLAKVLVKDVLNCTYQYINASDESGVDTIRHKVVNFANTYSFDGKIKVVILDETDGLSTVTASGKTSAQQALRNVMEEFSDTTRFILTANYPQKIIPALHSRCQQIDLTPPPDLFVKRCLYILKTEQVKLKDLDKSDLINFIKSKYPDLRKTINELQKNTVNNTLSLPNKKQTTISQDIYNMLVDKKTLNSIRQYIIENESEFGDYHDLMKGLFNLFYDSELSQDIKRDCMLTLTEHLYRDSIVMDHEINCFSAIILMNKILENQ
jgi:DNA polymerase III delta prime subunit